jgi:hypothetical protein
MSKDIFINPKAHNEMLLNIGNDAIDDLNSSMTHYIGIEPSELEPAISCNILYCLDVVLKPNGKKQ